MRDPLFVGVEIIAVRLDVDRLAKSPCRVGARVDNDVDLAGILYLDGPFLNFSVGYEQRVDFKVSPEPLSIVLA